MSNREDVTSKNQQRLLFLAKRFFHTPTDSTCSLVHNRHAKGVARHDPIAPLINLGVLVDVVPERLLSDVPTIKLVELG